MQTHHGLSARRADRTLGLSRSARHYTPRPRDDAALIEAIEMHLKDNPAALRTESRKAPTRPSLRNGCWNGSMTRWRR